MQDLIKQVAELAEMQKQVTPGPWSTLHIEDDHDFTATVIQTPIVDKPQRYGFICELSTERTQHVQNAAFIAAVGSLDFQSLAIALDTAEGNRHDSPEAAPADWQDWFKNSAVRAAADQEIHAELGLSGPAHDQAVCLWVHAYALGYAAARPAPVSTSLGGPNENFANAREAGEFYITTFLSENADGDPSAYKWTREDVLSLFMNGWGAAAERLVEPEDPGFTMSDSATQHWFGKDMADQMEEAGEHSTTVATESSPRWVPEAEWEKVHHKEVVGLYLLHQGWLTKNVYWDGFAKQWRNSASHEIFKRTIHYVAAEPTLPAFPALPHEKH